MLNNKKGLVEISEIEEKIEEMESVSQIQNMGPSREQVSLFKKSMSL